MITPIIMFNFWGRKMLFDFMMNILSWLRLCEKFTVTPFDAPSFTAYRRKGKIWIR